MTTKILHISTTSTGGAAASALRLHAGLLEKGYDSSIMFLNPAHRPISHSVHYKAGYSLLERTLSRFDIRPMPQKVQQQRLAGRSKEFSPFSFADIGYDITTHPDYRRADIINFHWVGKFVDLPLFFRSNKKPVVWTLHDMNAFTGGCHYSGDCEKYVGLCESCFQLAGTSNPDGARISLAAKMETIVPELMHIVSPSLWLHESARKSRLFQHVNSLHHIPYGVDTHVFSKLDKAESRAKLNLPQDKKILLFVSASMGNKRKGFDLLLEALESVKDREDVVLVSVGKSAQNHSGGNLISLGHINDELTLAAVYSAADLMIIPSREDNLPNVILESLACGTPVVGFPIGGLPDLILHGVTGLLSGDVSSAGLSEAIAAFLNGEYVFNSQAISDSIKRDYNLEAQAERYIALYEQIQGDVKK